MRIIKAYRNWTADREALKAWRAEWESNSQRAERVWWSVWQAAGLGIIALAALGLIACITVLVMFA